MSLAWKVFNSALVYFNSSSILKRSLVYHTCQSTLFEIHHHTLRVGVFNVVCDIPAQTITVSSSLSPRTVVNLVRRVMSTAHIINIAEAPPTAVLQPAYTTPVDRTRTTAYDDMYAYEGRSGYVPPYVAPYGGRSYDNEFRPGRYYNY